jgi:hypothetical protein
MKVDVYFEFAAVFDISELQVAKGQKFTLVSDTIGTWFSDNDPALSIDQKELNAHISADNVGKSILLSMPTGSFESQKKITITVVDAISQPAASLGITADQPQPK